MDLDLKRDIRQVTHRETMHRSILVALLIFNINVLNSLMNIYF